MRHWFEAGYFNADRLLVKNAEEIGPGFVPLRTAYPDDDSAFIPRNRSAIVTAPGALVAFLVCAKCPAWIVWLPRHLTTPLPTHPLPPSPSIFDACFFFS